jgi:hypothetical protein
MATILDEWRAGDLLIDLLRFCGIVALVGGILLILLAVLGGSPELYRTRFDLDLTELGGLIGIVGAALWAISWALRRLLGRT